MKDFIIIGSLNAVKYKEMFPLLKDEVLKMGYTVPSDYTQPEWCKTKTLTNTRWFTTLPVTDKEPLVLTARYSPEKYPKYNNYDAIEVGALKDIPFDYSGVMGVPISILDKYCPEQFEIVGCADANVLPEGWKGMSQEFVDLYYKQGNTGQYKAGNRLENYVWNGKAVRPYARILIRRRR